MFSLEYVHNKLYPLSNILLCIDSDLANWFVLKKLIRNQPCDCPALSHGSEITALLYSLFEELKNRLAGDPIVSTKNKMECITCGLSEGQFIMSFKTARSFTNIRKVLKLVSKYMNPTRLYKRYQKNIKMLNGTPHREEFIHCANILAKSLENTNIWISTPVDLSADRLKVLADVIKNNRNIEGFKEKGTVSASMKEEKHTTSYPTLTVKDDSFTNIVSAYLNKYSVANAVCGKKIIIYGTKVPDKLKDDKLIKLFVNKIVKNKLDLDTVLLSQAMESAELNCQQLKGIKNVKESQLVSIIKQTLNS